MASRYRNPAEAVALSKSPNFSKLNAGGLMFRQPSEIKVFNGHTSYELNENLDIEKWYRPVTSAASALELLQTTLNLEEEEEQDREAELRARWEEHPEEPKDKVPDQFVGAEQYLLLDRARRAAYAGLDVPSDLPWPEKLPSRAHLSRIAQRRPRPRPNSTAAKARESGGAVRPEPMFWGGDQRCVTLGRDYKIHRGIQRIVANRERRF